jgi:hypothetical protein
MWWVMPFSRQIRSAQVFGEQGEAQVTGVTLNDVDGGVMAGRK